MTFLPSVIHAQYRGGFRIHLTFNDRSERTVDFRPWLEGSVFDALKNPAYFREFFVDGGTVVWPNGADIAPETLYEGAASERTRGKPATAGKRPQRTTATATTRGSRRPGKPRRNRTAPNQRPKRRHSVK